MNSTGQIEVSILIVSHNTRDMTMACLDSILQQTRSIRFEVIAVDNASTDGSPEAIGNHPIRPRLFALKDNLGFGRANNLAASYARGRYLLLLNPDTVVLERAIDRLHQFAGMKPEALIWGGRTRFGDGRLNASNCWAAMTPWNLVCRATGLTGLFPRSTLFNGEAYGGWDRETPREVDIVSGCFLMIPRAFWDMLGGFDETFFMYGEEADLCLRARALGAKPAVTPRATIIHHGGASERTRAGKMIKLLSAKVLLIKRHWSPRRRPLGLALMLAWPLTRWIATELHADLTGSVAARERAHMWKAVWLARREWQGGYRDSAEKRSPRAVALTGAGG